MSTDPAHLGRVRTARRELAEVGPGQLRSDADFERVSVPEGACDVLRDLLVAEHARVVLEVGLAYGSSALAIAEALVAEGTDGAHHLIIDAFQDHFHDVGWNAIVATGLTGICTLLRERSEFALPRLAAEGFVADAAFVDGSHVFHYVFIDLFFAGKLVRPGGLVVLDDCEWPSVATAANYFELNAGWTRQPIDGETRLRAYRVPGNKIEPSFEAFASFGLDSTD
jgi:predicted O-methyltransferase YrrM